MDSSLKRNLAWDYLSKFGNTFFSLITTSILARLLTPADYGLVGISAAVNGIAGIFFNFGLASAIIQADKLDKKILSTVFYFNQMIAVSLWLLIFISADSIEHFYKIDQLSNVLFFTSLVFIINGALMVPNALLSKEMKFKTISLISLASNFLSGTIGIILAMNNFGVWSLVVQQLCNSFFILTGSYFVTRWYPIIFFNIKSIYPMLKFGFFMFLSGLLDGIFSRIDIFLIAKIFSAGTLGLYTRAQGLESQVRILSANSLIGVLFPAFTKIKHDTEELKRLYYRFFELVSFSFCLLAGIFFIGAEQLFLLLFGPQWNISAHYFQLLIIVGFAYPLSSLTLSIIEARGNSKSFFKLEIIKKLLFLPTYFIAYYYGIEAYLLSYIVFCIIGTFVNVLFLTFEIPIKVFVTVLQLGRYFTSSVFIILILFLVQQQLKYANSLIIAGTEIALFTGIYFTIHQLAKSKGLKYSIELIRNKS